MDLLNKVVIVTGAGQGIGQAIALAFAQQGAHLVLASRSQETLEQTQKHIAELGGTSQVLVVPTDVCNEQSVQQMAEQTLAHFDRIDCLVCNAGIAGPTAPLVDIELAQWQETLATNLTGPFLCCRAVLPQMLKQQEGSIIFVGSGTGKNPLPGRTAYAASKIGLVGIARTLAHEVGAANVRVNVVSPGPVEGPRIQSVLHKQAALRGLTYEQVRQQATRDAALHRFTPVEDVASAVVFLAAADSVTGEDLNVSSGLVLI
jgi:Dehydrogenases with different specificities (related to short-chain alcohol dehydrogenases)